MSLVQRILLQRGQKPIFGLVTDATTPTHPAGGRANIGTSISIFFFFHFWNGLEMEVPVFLVHLIPSPFQKWKKSKLSLY